MLRGTVAAVLLLAATAASAAPAESGRDLATRLGCASCHSEGFAGHKILDDPTIATLWSANITRVVPRSSDRDLERTIRTGVRPDGSHLWMMAAAPYSQLTPGDMRDLLAFLRSLPSSGEDHPRVRMGPRFIKAVNAKRLQPEAIEQARDTEVPVDLGPKYARGRYLARTSCAGCHYPSLRGLPQPQAGDAPDLIVAAGYDRDQFRTLLRTGKATDGRTVGVMSEEAPKRFAGMADADIDAIHNYLVARAAARR